MSGAGVSGKSFAPVAFSSSSLKGKLNRIHDRSRSRPKPGANQEDSESQGEICRCSPLSNPGGSRTVRRILAACFISLLTLLGSISLDLNNSFQMWKSTKEALQGLSSCGNMQTVHMIQSLQEVRQLYCWGRPGNSSTKTTQFRHQHLQEILKTICTLNQDRFQISSSHCEGMQTSKCWIYKGELEQKLNTTSGPELAFMLSRIISELLDNFQAEEEDLNHARSNLDWADVSALRIILKVKEAALQAHHLDRFLELETARTHWSQLTTILNYAVFTSEILLNCWGENENLTLYMSQLEDPFFSVPFTVVVPRTHLMQFVSGLESVQECLTQRGFEKLNEKSREILSLVSLKVSLLTIACLIYPIVLVSFKQMTEWIQNYARSLRERTEDLKRERHLAEELLHQMLPKYVAKQLRKHKHVEAESYDQVSIFFSDIVGFTGISASCTPLQVVEMLNNLYVCFDSRIDSYNVYKVETIGDAYMVVSGLPERNGVKHADEIAKMSLDLVAAVRQVTVPHMPNERLQMRAGIHTGPCVAGVVGYKMPRYCLFGDTVNTASRMESTSLPQKIHISSATYDVLIVDGAYEIEPRGETEIKGKGKMKTYWLIGNKNYSVQNNSLVCHWNPAISRQKKLESSLCSTLQSSTGTMAPQRSERTTPAFGENPGAPEPALGGQGLGSNLSQGQKMAANDTSSTSGSVHPGCQPCSETIPTISEPLPSVNRDCTASLTWGPNRGTIRTLETNLMLPGFVDGT